jgi:hypothetical protein
MMESKGFSCSVFAGRDGPDAARLWLIDVHEPPATTVDVHRICGQLCGQAQEFRRKAAALLRRGPPAQKMGTEKSMQINGLHQHDDFATLAFGCFALTGAAVDFQTRIGGRIARD